MERMLVVVFDNEKKAFEGKIGPSAAGGGRQHQYLRGGSGRQACGRHRQRQAARRRRADRHAHRDGRGQSDRAAGWTGGAGHRRRSGLTIGAFYDIDTAPRRRGFRRTTCRNR